MVTIPEWGGHSWVPVVDTSKPPPYDFLQPSDPAYGPAVAQTAGLLANRVYPMMSYSAVVLRAARNA